MRYKYLQKPQSNLGAQDEQDALLTQIAAQPTTGDKAIMAAGQGLTQLLKYHSGQQVLKAKAAEEKQRRNEQILDMKFKAGMLLEDKEFIDLGIDPVKGREWENQKLAKDQSSHQIELYRAGLPSIHGQKLPTPKNPIRIVDNSYRQVMYNPQTGTSTYARDPQGAILHAPPPPSGIAAADLAAARQAALTDKYSKMLVKSIAKKDQFGYPIVVGDEPQYTDNWNEKQYQVLIKQKLTPETKLLVDALREQYYDETAEKILLQPNKQGEGLTGRVEE